VRERPPGPRAHQRARYVLRCARPLKPATVLFEGDDPRAYIIASNIARRHMSKGQQAMAVAYPEPAKTKRKRSGSLEPTPFPRLRWEREVRLWRTANVASVTFARNLRRTSGGPWYDRVR
jgi:hypothetical protein